MIVENPNRTENLISELTVVWVSSVKNYSYFFN